MADEPAKEPSPSMGLTEEQIRKITQDTVKSTLAAMKEAEAPEEDTDDDYTYPPAQESYYPPEEPTQGQPQQFYDPRVDELTKAVQQGTRDNATNKFNYGWNELVHQRPELGEFTQRANKTINEMIDQGMITTPEKMAQNFLGEKMFNEMNVGSPETGVPPSIAPANPTGPAEKPLKEMTDEEFEEWEETHAGDKI